MITAILEIQLLQYQITGNSDFDLAPINVGPNIKVEQPNKNQTIINGGYSTNILATELTEEEYINATSLVNSVLDNLASIGDAIKYEADTSFYENQTLILFQASTSY